jgi:hypothetical protein
MRLLIVLALCCGCGAVQQSAPGPALTRSEAEAASKKAQSDLKTIVAFAKTYYAANNDFPGDGALGSDSSTAGIAPYRLAVARSTFPHWHTIEVRGVSSSGYADVPAWVEPRHSAEPWMAFALIGNLDGDSELDVYTADLAGNVQHDIKDF